ncbi:MAG: hypothetical protein CM1200mP36_04410 [Gammaproteobacteria bacterium]|nr:MAG: hypothetical protein CM1200mP36_04410 [Gammaproteobacteria bacterium]
MGFDEEIVPLATVKLVKDKETGTISEEAVALAQDEGNRPSTTLEGLATLKPVVGEEKPSRQAMHRSSPTGHRPASS